MNASIVWIDQTDEQLSEPAELPDAEEPEQDVPLGIEAEEPTIADDIKKDDAAADEVPTSIDEDEDEEEVDEDDEEDFDDDDDEDEDEELDEDDDPAEAEEIDLK